MDYPIPKGVFDIVPYGLSSEEEWRASDRWAFVEEILRKTALQYGFKEIRTPMFERTELFVRGVGETSDIVTKEMYTFLDRGERSMTLRPEGTAPVIRSFISEQLYTVTTLHKFFYLAPMFRYERPQAGRFRQHHQFGAEAIGIGAPEQDVELIDLLMTGYRRLGLQGLHVSLNSVGDVTSRAAYRKALIDFLRPHLSHLSAESQTRFEKNPLRILDSKNPNDQKILEKVPSIIDFLNGESRDHFEQVKKGLQALKIPFTVEPSLVRGLDYYQKTVFEISSGLLGAQNAVGGGGRYDGLTDELGGPSLPSIGFGTGLERVIQTMMKQKVHFPQAPSPFAFFIPMGVKALDTAFGLVSELRHQGIYAEIDLSGKKMQNGLQLADQLKATYAIIIGDEELHSRKVKFKEMATRSATEHDLDSLCADLTRLFKDMYVRLS